MFKTSAICDLLSCDEQPSRII